MNRPTEVPTGGPRAAAGFGRQVPPLRLDGGSKSCCSAVLIEPDFNQLRDAEFNSDGSRLVTAGQEGRVRVWDVRTHASTGDLFEAGNSPVSTASFSPGGTSVLSASDDGTAQVRDPSSGRVLLRLTEPGGAGLTSAAFSSHGSRIVTAAGDRKVRVFDLAWLDARDERERALAVAPRVLTGHTGFVHYAGWTDKLHPVLGGVNPVAAPFLSFSLPEPTGVVGVVAPDEPALLGLVAGLFNASANLGDLRAAIQEVRLFRIVPVVISGTGKLGHGLGFAGHERLGDGASRGLDDAAVGRDLIACFQHHQVPDHDFFQRDRAEIIGAQHLDLRGGAPGIQEIEFAVALVFASKGDACVQDNGQQDGEGPQAHLQRGHDDWPRAAARAAAHGDEP